MVTASAASCDEEDAVGSACHLHQQDWGIPVVVESAAPAVLRLALGSAQPLPDGDD